MYSQLVMEILSREKERRQQLNIACSTPESVVYAIVSYFDQFSKQELSIEEQKVQFVLKTILRSGLSLTKHYYSAAMKRTNYAYDYLSSLQNKFSNMITCDLLLVLCLQDVDETHLQPIQPEYRSIDIEAFLDEIYQTFVVNKTQETKEVDDLKSVDCFIDEVYFQKLFHEHLQINVKNQQLSIVIPYFFKDEPPLQLTVIKKEDMYYIHDHGCAFEALNHHLNDENQCETLIRHFLSGTVCHLQNRQVVGSLNSLPYFSIYLQYLVLIANLDLIDGIYQADDEYDRDWIDFEGQDPLDDVVEYFGYFFNVDVDQTIGTMVKSCLFYLGNATNSCFSFIKQNEQVIISDVYNSYDEGAIFENLWYTVDDMTPYIPFIKTVTNRFGGYFDGKNVHLAFEYNDETLLIRSFFQFIQLAIVLAPMNHLYDLAKIIENYPILC